MRAGLMRRQVTVLGSERVPDGGGGYTEQPVEIATVWSRVEPLQGREQILAMQTGMQRPYRFTLRYRPGVTGAKMLQYDGRRFDITSVVDPEERHRQLVIMAEEVV